MRISDWSSDVCSSYLVLRKASELAAAGQRRSELRTDVVEERAVVRLAGDSRIRFESARMVVDLRLVIDCHANKRRASLLLRRRRSEPQDAHQERDRVLHLLPPPHRRESPASA